MSRQSPFEHLTKSHQVCRSKLLAFPHLPLQVKLSYYTTTTIKSLGKILISRNSKTKYKSCMNTSLPACKQLQASFFLVIFPKLPENEYNMKSVTVFSKVWTKKKEMAYNHSKCCYCHISLFRCSFWVYMPANRIKYDRNNFSSIPSYFSLQIMLRLLYVTCWKQNSD